VQEFPEHSSKFNRFVKLSQTATGFGGGLTVEACKANPKLAAFVKLLARKMKETEAKKTQSEANSQNETPTRKNEISSEKPKAEEFHGTAQSKENNGVTRHP